MRVSSTRSPLPATAILLALGATGCEIADLLRSKDEGIDLKTLNTTLSGMSEVPPADPNGTGAAVLTVSPERGMLCFDVKVQNITPVTEAHVHRAPAGVNGPVIVDLDTQSIMPKSCDGGEVVARLRAGDGAAGDAFGRALSFDGDTALVGANGAAYVFVQKGGTWSEQQKLIAPKAKLFGASVAVSGDTAAIAAENEVHLFVREYGNWSKQDVLRSPGDGAFGKAVALSGDTLVVGAPTFSTEGAVFVYQRSGAAWNEQARVRSELPFPGQFGCFGCAVAVDGDTALVGSLAGPVRDVGFADVLERSGTTWTRTRLTQGDTLGGQLGRAVAIDGDTAIVGAPGNLIFDGERPVGRGTAEVFARTDDAWSRQEMAVDPDNPERGPADALTPSDLPAESGFGSAVAVAGDLSVVGAPVANAAYVFARSGELWSDVDRLSQPGGAYGTTVALSNTTALVGAPGDGSTQGAVFVHELEQSPGCELRSQAFTGCVEVDRHVLHAIHDDPAQYYLNVHTEEYPDGAVRGQLQEPPTAGRY
jgi:hypothetical protein